MIKAIIGGAAAFALLSGSAAAAVRILPMGWVVVPADTVCRVELDLTGRSGAVTPVSLISDGQVVSLKFAKQDLPSRAFLPIRIDHVRYSNLMLRGEDGTGEMVLSAESEAALRRGGTLDIAWLGEEPLSGSLAGSEQGLADLRVCGAQTAARSRERAASEQDAKTRAEAEARAQALSEAQIAAVRAQAAAAEAQRRQLEDAADRQKRLEAADQERAYQEDRQRAYETARRRGVYYPSPQDDEYDDRWAPYYRPN